MKIKSLQVQKKTIFVPSKITKDELQSVISGTRPVANGDTIQAALSYTRGEKRTSPINKGAERGFETEK